MSARPCKECGRRPKLQGRHRCETCRLRHEPIDAQVQAARRRLGMVPEELRRKRSKALEALAPASTSWCAGCQSFRDLADFGKGATRCRACASATSHASMVAKTYGLSAEGYAELLERQGGKCAICRARPVSKRLAVDHDHASGAVRGLLCSRCNHDLLGSAWDSLALATALWHYLNTPPAGGAWLPPEKAAPLVASPSAAHEHDVAIEAKRPAPSLGLVTAGGTSATPVDKPLYRMTRDELKALQSATNAACMREHFLPVGSEGMPGYPGAYRVWIADDPDTPPPF